MKHKFNKEEIGYDLVNNIKEYFCENCQKCIASQTSPKDKIIYNDEWNNECILDEINFHWRKMIMVNTRVKGNAARLEVKKLLENKGWKMAIVENPSRYAKEKDLFGVADLLGIKQDLIMMVQVRKARDAHPHAPYVQFMKQFGGTHIIMYQYHLRDRDSMIVYEYHDWGYYKILGPNDCHMVKVK